MRETDKSFAYAVAERLRKSIETTPIDISRAPHKLGITISIGIASSEGTGDTAEALLRRADQALYSAKRNGRNRVVADAAEALISPPGSTRLPSGTIAAIER